MIFSSRILSISLASIGAASLVMAQGQKPAPSQDDTLDKSSAYYHYSLAHLYAEMAGAYGNRGEFVNKAIDQYRLAMKSDPGSSYLSEELSDLYIQSGRLRDAVMEAEDALKNNPNDVSAHRILGRIYTRMMGDTQAGRGIDENMLKKAIDQYTKIADLAPKDADTWLMLGRLQKIAGNSVEAEKDFKKVLDLDTDNEDALMGLAMVYGDVGNTKAATELLRKVAEKNPSLRTLTVLAQSYEQVHEYSLAAETLRRAMQVASGNLDVKKEYAQDLLLADQFNDALKVYQELTQEDPKDAMSYLRMSQIYRQQKDMAKAREAANKAKEVDPNSLEIRYNDVNLLDAEGKVNEAIAALKDILASTTKRTYRPEERSNRVQLLERLALLYRENDQTQESVDTLRQLSDVDPDVAPRAAAQIIDTYRLAKDFKKAAAEADAAEKRFPTDKTIKGVRASVLADVGRGDEAVAEMKRATEGKTDRDSYISMAEIYEKTKNYGEMAKALDAAEKLSESKEDKEAVAFMRGAMYEKLKQYDKAEAEFRRVLETNPNNAGALNYLGYMLADRNVRLREAQELVTKALENDPNNGAYLDSLGWVYYKLDRLPEAEQYLRRAMEKYAKDPTVHDHLGDVLFKQGKVRDAIAQWQASLKEWDNSPQSELEPTEVAKVQKKLESAKVRLAREQNGAPVPKEQ